MSGSIISSIQTIALDPLISGSLLSALTLAPQHLRDRLLEPFRNNLLSKHASTRIRTVIWILKFLFAAGVARRLHQSLNRLALNYWHLRSPGPAWNFGGDGKTELVLITGGCSGFGYEMVKKFSGKARIVILDILELPQELSKLPEVHYYKCDLTNFQEIISVTSELRNRHGNPTVLINNAGIAGTLGTHLVNTNTDFLEKIFKVNLLSHFVMIREILPGMLEAQKGHVVTVASLASFGGASGMADYCATKAGALSLHESLRSELRSDLPNGHCVQVTSVHPSWHATGMVRPYFEVIKRAGIKIDPASNVADLVVDQVLQGRSGQLIVPKSTSGLAYTRMWPTWWVEWKSGSVARMMKLRKPS